MKRPDATAAAPRAGLRQPGHAAARRRVLRRGGTGLPERPGSGAAGSRAGRTCWAICTRARATRRRRSPISPALRDRAGRRAGADLAGPSPSRSGRAGEGAAALRARQDAGATRWWPGSSDWGRRRWRSATTRAPWPRSRKRSPCSPPPPACTRRWRWRTAALATPPGPRRTSSSGATPRCCVPDPGAAAARSVAAERAVVRAARGAGAGSRVCRPDGPRPGSKA